MIPSSTAGLSQIKDLTNLAKEFNFYAKGSKQIADTKAFKSQFTALKNGITSTKKTAETASVAAKNADAVATKAKKVTDLLQKGAFKEISPKWGGALGILLQVASAGVVLLSIKSQEEIQGINLKTGNRIEIDLQNAFTRSINNTIEIRGLQKQIIAQNKIIADNKDNISRTNLIAEKGRKLANDALYEAREGRKIIESALKQRFTEINKFLSAIQDRVKDIQIDATNKQKELVNKFNDQIKTINSQVKTVDSQIKTVEIKQTKEIQQVKAEIKEVEKGSIGAVQSKLTEFQKQINVQGFLSREIEAKINREIDIELKKADVATARALLSFRRELKDQITKIEFEKDGIKNQIQKLLLDKNKSDLLQDKFVELERANKKSADILNNIVSDFTKVADKRIEQSTANQNKQIQEVNKKVEKVEKDQEGVFTNIVRINDRIAAVDQYRKADTKFLITRVNDEIVRVQQNVDGQLKDVDKRVIENIQPTIKRTVTETVKPQIEEIVKGNETLTKEIDKIKPQIDTINTKIKQQEKVNADAIPLLNSILGLIPAIPARTAGLITPSIPTIPQIEQAAATGTCRTTQPGGCSRKMMDDAINSINGNTNRGNGNLLNAINTGANAAQLAMLTRIDNKLGVQMPGGIAGKLTRFTQWLQLDRALNILTFAATVHNALMLSNDIGQTLIGAINNVLELIGLKDDDGKKFDIGKVISSTVENFIKSIVGAENYQEMTTAWAKANRIYQATVNVLNTFQGLASTILSGLEMTLGNVSKIGNALRKSGEVLESAYSWMNPQPKLNRVSETLEKLQNGASTIQMVTQAPLDVINATTELTNATTELTKSIKEDGKPENKGKEAPEPDNLKAVESTAKLASVGLELADLDFDSDD